MSAHNRVMFVDDEEGVRQSWDRLLSEHGFDVTTATDGRVAVTELREHPMDVVVSDWRMPVMDGLELLAWVRQEQPETQFILLTGYGNEEVERMARELGVYEYLNKPISPEALAAIVTAAASLTEDAPAGSGTTAAVEAPAEAAEAPAAELEEVEPEAVELEAVEPEAVESDATEHRLTRTLKTAGSLVAAPVLGLAFVIALPLIGFFAFAWLVGQRVWRVIRPVGSSA